MQLLMSLRSWDLNVLLLSWQHHLTVWQVFFVVLNFWVVYTDWLLSQRLIRWSRPWLWSLVCLSIWGLDSKWLSYLALRGGGARQLWRICFCDSLYISLCAWEPVSLLRPEMYVDCRVSYPKGAAQCSLEWFDCMRVCLTCCALKWYGYCVSRHAEAAQDSFEDWIASECRVNVQLDRAVHLRFAVCLSRCRRRHDNVCLFECLNVWRRMMVSWMFDDLCMPISGWGKSFMDPWVFRLCESPALRHIH